MNGTVSLRSVHGKYLSAQPDGRAEWNRTIAAEWEYFQVEQRHNGKITLKSAHGTYVSAQPDGSVQINRREAPPGGWEVFTVEDRGNNVVCLKSCHGKYLSAQQNGTAQWNRDHAPRGGWEDIQFVQQGATGQQQPATNTASMPSYVIVAQAGSSEVNGNYEFVPGKHENRHWGTIAGHYQHTQNPEIFIAFQDCGKSHQRSEWNKWMIISKIKYYAAHTGGKIGVPPREGGWETVDSWGIYRAHPAVNMYQHSITRPTLRLKLNNTSTLAIPPCLIQMNQFSCWKPYGKPVRFKLNNPPNHNDAWVGIYQTGAPDQDHVAQNQRWKYIRDIDVNNVSLSNGGWAEGDWGIRVFSDGGYTLVERKDFTIHSAHNKQHGESPLVATTSHHTTQTVASQPLDEPAEKPGRRGIWIVALFGIFLILPGLPLLIVGSSMGEIGMIIPGAILTGFGAFLTVGAWLVNVSSWSKSYAESGKPAPRWTKVAAVFAVLLLIPGVILLVIGSIYESFVVQSESNATLEIDFSM